VDLRNEKLGYKIREAEVQKIPYMIVIGDKEVSTATVAPRGRKGEKIPSLTVPEFIARVAAESVPGGAP
jgi:threonyl-tRNA synthetase